MSEKHPVVAITGSSGAGTTSVRVAFEHIFFRESVTPVVDMMKRKDTDRPRLSVADQRGLRIT